MVDSINCICRSTAKTQLPGAGLDRFVIVTRAWRLGLTGVCIIFGGGMTGISVDKLIESSLSISGGKKCNGES